MINSSPVKLSKHEMSDKELFQYLDELKDYPKPVI